MLKSDESLQVQDEPELLAQMMTELERASELYKPTNYWHHYEKIFLPELRKQGLRDFRRRIGSVLGSFGAVDVAPAELRFSRNFRGAGKLNRLLNRTFDAMPFLSLQSAVLPHNDELVAYFHWLVGKKFARTKLQLSACSTSSFGNPKGVVELDGGKWTLLHLQYCSMVIDAAEHIPFGKADVICELGGGLGRNVEVMGRLFPEATFLYFDIPPQLYVANQYLRNVFGSRVIDYRRAVELPPGKLDKELRGKIYEMLPTWRMPDWANAGAKINLFWNCASFQEMEPNVVENYLGLVMKMKPSRIYIEAMPRGNDWGEWKEGRGGTKQLVTEACYQNALARGYELAVKYPSDLFLSAPNHHTCYVFRPKS